MVPPKAHWQVEVASAQGIPPMLADLGHDYVLSDLGGC
jgi:hypothetical protein